MTEECRANQWADIAAHFKAYFDDHKEAYRAIVTQCTRDMKEVVATDVTVL